MTINRNSVIGSVISPVVDDATLAAAKAGDRDAGASVLADMSQRLVRMAKRFVAQAFTEDQGGLRDAYLDDFIQEANLVAWECLTRYEGDSLDDFRAYAYRYAEGELKTLARNLANGTDDDSEGKKIFATLVKHFRDADVRHQLTEADYQSLAEKAVQDKDFLSGFRGAGFAAKRMSAERAAAARLAYQGSVSIYRPVGDSDDADTTIADTLVAQAAVEDQADLDLGGVRPFQWVVAARVVEEELTLPRDEEARSALLNAVDRFRAGTILESDLDLLEAQPCRSQELGDAVAMLRSLFNQRQAKPVRGRAEDTVDAALGRGSVALNAQRDLLEKGLESITRRMLVRKVVGMLGPAQAYVLAATFGFQGMGTFKDDKAIARAMNRAGFEDQTEATVVRNRNKARAAFAKKWSDLVAKNGSEAAAMDEAARKAAANDAKAQAKGITFLADLQED